MSACPTIAPESSPAPRSLSTDCSTCKLDCAACKPPVREPATVEPAVDWHCFDLHRPGGLVSGFCYSLARMCEQQRERAVARRIGKPMACTTEPTVFCFRTTDSVSMGGQTLCARTEENCAERRQDVLDIKPRLVSHVTRCERTLNVNPRDPARDAVSPDDSP